MHSKRNWGVNWKPANVGGVTDLTIDSVGTIVVGASEFTVTSIPDPIAPGATGDIKVTFDSASATGGS